MNPEYNSPKKENPFDEIELNGSDSLDDFIKELEAKEKDLHLSLSDAVIEIEEIDIEDSEEKELLKLLESLEKTAVEPTSFTNSGNNYFPNHQAISETDKEVLQLRKEVSKLTNERAEMNDSLKRRQQEFENFRKRIERERSEIFRSLLCNMAMKMLPVVDNLNRALDSTASYSTEKTKDFQQFIDGINLVNHQLDDVLGEMGIKPIMSVGKPFNPHFHEAVAIEQTNEVAPNTIIAELVRGYFIDDKVIRHSMVKVSAADLGKDSKELMPNVEEDVLDVETE